MNNDYIKNTGYGGNAMASRATEPTAVPAISFDLKLARELALASAQAYTLAGVDNMQVIYDSVTDSSAILVELPDSFRVAFRGTKDVRNWLTDAEFGKVPVGHDVRVHAGFLRATDAITPLIWEKIGHHALCQKSLVFGGHSLGGAVAVQSAYEMRQAGYTVDAVYTFGSPRVGNAGWRDAYNKVLGHCTFRIACVGDLVPLLPGIFTTPFDGYRHVGREVFLRRDRYELEPSHLLEMWNDGVDASSALKRLDVDYILQRHSITADYIETLDAIAAKQAEDLAE